MEIIVKNGPIPKVEAELAVLGFFEGERMQSPLATIDRAMRGGLRKILSTEGFTGKFLQTILIRPDRPKGLKRLILVGLGKREEITEDRLRQAMGKGATAANAIGAHSIMLDCDTRFVGKGTVRELAQTFVEGVILSLYTLDRLKSGAVKDKPIKQCVLVVPEQKQVAQGEKGGAQGKVIAEAVHFVRDLCNLPSNIVTPSYLAQEAKAIADEGRMALTILERADAEKLGMGAYLAVARGTDEAPKFIVMEYKGTTGERPIALIGKSVTFDTGGISLKPSERMEQMKYDMSGGATVLGVMKVISRLKLPVHVVAILPATDNMPSGSAVHPGDVVTALSGLTIEIDNTDAEGRLCLADALAYAARYKPRAMIDLATLTGACVVALGQHAIGMMGNQESLISEIKSAGEESGERLWQLPLWDDYFDQIKGEVADLKNVGGRGAGAITAGLFLKQFVGDIPWVHLDIAGTSWYSDAKHPYIPKGSTGIGVRLLVRYLIKQSKRKKR